MLGFIGVILLLFGVINVTSESAGVYGWISVLIGATLTIKMLSGPYVRGKYGNGGDGAYHSDSGSDGGGGGGGE